MSVENGKLENSNDNTEKQLADILISSNTPKRTTSPIQPEMKPEVGQIDIVIQETFFIHENFVGLVIGRYGGNIRDIQGQSGCRLNFTDETNQDHRICLLQGAKFQIEHAKRLITELIRKRRDVQNEPMNNNSEEGEKILHILIPAARCRMVIGKGGEKIREMSTHFDVHMHLIQDNNDDRVHDKFLEIRGKSEKVDKAHNYVQENFVDGSGLFRLPNKDLSGSENKLTRKVMIQPRFMKFMIGKNGSVIKDIQLKSGATVAVNHEEDPNSEHFAIVEGTEGQVENAIKMIKDKMSPRVHQTQSYFHRVRRDKALQLIANRLYLLNQIRIRSKTKISYRDDQVSGDYVFEIHGRHSQIQNAIYLMEQDLGSKTNPLSHSMHYPLVMNMAAPIPLYHGNARVLGDPVIESRGNFCYSAPGTAGTALHGLATGNLQHNGYGDAPVYNQVIQPQATTITQQPVPTSIYGSSQYGVFTSQHTAFMPQPLPLPTQQPPQASTFYMQALPMYPNGDSAVMTQQQPYSYVNMNQQLDYRPDWINFYRQIGNHEVADQIEKDMYEQKGHLILGQGVCVQTSFPIPAQQNLINGTNHSQGLK